MIAIPLGYSVHRNIKVAYILAFLAKCLFWSGIWIFFYLNFTNYAGIGLIESVVLITGFISEIPTGVLTDSIGKKRALALSFCLIAVGNLLLGLATSLNNIIPSLVIFGIGAAFYSGTLEGFVYESLKEAGIEDRYNRVIANLRSFELLAIVFASSLGGLAYGVNQSYPFFMTGIAAFLGLLLVTLLREPKVIITKSLNSNFLTRSKNGFRELFATPLMRKKITMLLIIGFGIVICAEILNDALAVEFGFSPSQLGILWSVVALVSAGCSQLSHRINSKSESLNHSLLIIVGFAIAVSLIISPYIGIIVGAVTLLIRISLQTIFDNLTSVYLNKEIQSSTRVTTLSTFNLLKRLPYVVGAFFIGGLMDAYSAKNISLVLGIILIILLIMQYLFFRQEKTSAVRLAQN